MTYKGIVKNNIIVLDPPVPLANGTVVEIIPVDTSITDSGNSDPICGSWNDDRSAEEIIDDIRTTRYSRNKVIDL